MRRLAFQTLSKTSPKKGMDADQYADAEIGGHAHEGDVRNAAHPGGDRDDEREHAGQHVAQAGDEADDAVEAKANAGAGNAKASSSRTSSGSSVSSRKSHAPRFQRSPGRGAFTGNCWRPGLGALASTGHLRRGHERACRHCFDATIDRVHGGYSSAAERLTVAQDVVGSIPTSRPNKYLH